MYYKLNTQHKTTLNDIKIKTFKAVLFSATTIHATL